MTCKIVLNEQEIRKIIADYFGIKNVDKVWLYLDQCEVEIANNFKREYLRNKSLVIWIEN